MTVSDLVVQKLHTLSAENQQKVLRFVESLTPAPVPRKDPRGMFSHLGVRIALEDMEEARRETWTHFPRPFPDERTS